MTKDKTPVVSSRHEVDQFLKKVAKTPVVTSESHGRLIFAMDATASREPSWDHACHLHGQMFSATRNVGSLLVQLCYYHGFNKFHASPWCPSAEDLLNEMSSVRCLGGHTQIHRVLEHARTEHKANPIRAVVFVGDAVEESVDKLCNEAGLMGMLNLPLFMFQEGNHPQVRSAFQQMAHLSGGAYAPFDLSSASQLKDLLSAVAVFAAGGRKALQQLGQSNSPVAMISQQLDK